MQTSPGNRVHPFWSIPMKQIYAVLFAVVLVPLLGRSVSTQTMGQPEHFSAGAIDINKGVAGRIEINVDRWSTAADRERLTGALHAQGPDALLKMVQDMKPVGRIYTPDSLGYDLRYAQQRPGPDGGRDIVLVTDRPVSFWEATNRPRSIQYPFTIIQIHMNPKGDGEGKLALATKITADPDTKMIEIEDFAHQPVQLTDVKSEPKH
jgi:hypothetical protein